MMKKILLCRTAWMKNYNGRANIDIPRSGSKYIQENKTGGEIYNFKNVKGKSYAYFPYITDLAIQNLGADRNDDLIEGVTIVFCATHPIEGGIRVVGWHKNAKIFRSEQSNSHSEIFHSVTEYKNTVLIPEDDRVFKLPETFGRSSLYYIALHPHKRRLLEKLEKYIKEGGKLKLPRKRVKNKSTRARQPDINKRIKVEQTAVKIATKYYEDRYGTDCVSSVEKDNKGWDLEVRTGNTKINIEVKGLSGRDLIVELTPNEYKIFSDAKPNYQLFVVTEALSKKPVSKIYKFQTKGKMWVGNDGSLLKIIPVKSARLTTK